MAVDIPSKADLLALALETDRRCVSIYMPTHPKGPAIRQDPIRLRNLLRKAATALEASGGDPKILAHAESLPEDETFWQSGAAGLALFLGDDTFAKFRLPFSPEEQVIVAPRFYLRPLFPLLVGDGAFHLLAIAQGGLRLF